MKKTLAIVAVAALALTGCSTQAAPVAPAETPVVGTSTPATTDSSILAFGQTWESPRTGAKITATKGEAFTSSEYAIPDNAASVKFHYTVVAGDTAIEEFYLFTTNAVAGGKTAEQVFDDKLDSTLSYPSRLIPGQSYSFTLGYTGDVDADWVIDIPSAGITFTEAAR